MRFLLDANLPRMALSLITRFGHEASSVHDVGLGDVPMRKLPHMLAEPQPS